MPATTATRPGVRHERAECDGEPSTTSGLRKSVRGFLRRVLQGDLGEFRVVLGLIVIWAIFQSQEDRFLTSVNLTNLVLQMTAIGLISVGIVLVLLLGEIDLSVGAVSGLCASIMAVLVVKHGWSPYLGDRRRDRCRGGDRDDPGHGLHPLRRALVRRHPGGLLGLAGGPAAGARRDRHDQHHRPEDHRPDEHLLRRRDRLDHRDRRHRGLRRDGAARSPAPGERGPAQWRRSAPRW